MQQSAKTNREREGDVALRNIEWRQETAAALVSGLAIGEDMHVFWSKAAGKKALVLCKNPRAHINAHIWPNLLQSHADKQQPCLNGGK